MQSTVCVSHLAGVLAGIVQQSVSSTRVILYKCTHIIQSAVNAQHTATLCVTACCSPVQPALLKLQVEALPALWWRVNCRVEVVAVPTACSCCYCWCAPQLCKPPVPHDAPRCVVCLQQHAVMSSGRMFVSVSFRQCCTSLLRRLHRRCAERRRQLQH
jgi:hypothetical protein